MSISKKDIVTELTRLGVSTGMMLEVHCSLRSFGKVDGGAITVIEALKHIVGTDGAIVMPAYMHSMPCPLSETDVKLGLTLKIKYLHDENEQTSMGIVSDTFKKMPDVVTGQGIFRVSAWGRDAEKHAASGFQYLIDSSGYALLAGVDIYRMSSMHYVEDCMPDEIKNRFEPPEEARAIYPESEWFIEAWSPPVKPWYTLQEQAYNEGYIKDIMIGNAKCMLVQVKDTIELYRQALTNDPYKLYGLT